MHGHTRSVYSSTRPLTRIVVVGFGFGGFSFCREMRRSLGRAGMRDVDLLVISDQRYITFTPLLPELAVSRLSAASVSADIESLAQKLGFRFMLGKVDSIDMRAGKVFVTDEEIEFDIIVLSTGSSDNFHGMSISGKKVVSLRDIEDAYVIAEKLLGSQITWEMPDEPRYQVAVIGGGQTGVEAASFLAEKLKEIRQTTSMYSGGVILLEASSRILSREPEVASEISERILRRRGVDCRTNMNIKNIEGSKIHLSSGETLDADTIIWAAGIRPNTSLLVTPGVIQTEKGRIVVDAHLEIQGIKNAYAIGDIASLKDWDGKTLPENASVAVQEGRFLAMHIANSIPEGKHRKETGFRYRDFGHVIPLGHDSLFIGPKNLVLTGFPGRVIAWFIHYVELFTNNNRIRFLCESLAFLGRKENEGQSGDGSGIPPGITAH